ncbi:MAG: metal-dependent hydrolase [Thiobacillus sp.]|nr:metal-dependent hydrolase [Thiobacillus sp.]
MFIAHLPAGYLTARAYCRHAGITPLSTIILAGLAGGIVPDLDLVYGALVDGGRVHHHRYWTHLPLVWLAVSAAALTLCPRASGWRHVTTSFLLAAWGHLLLDSVAGDIWWLWPWFDVPFSLVAIPALHAHWVLNYLLHWTFVLELAIVALATWMEGARPLLRRSRWVPS